MSHRYSLHMYCSEPSETTFTSKSSNYKPRDGNCRPHAGLEETRNTKDWTLTAYCARILVCGFERQAAIQLWVDLGVSLIRKIKKKPKLQAGSSPPFFLLKKDNDGSQEKDIFKNKWQQAAQILTSHVKAKRIKRNSMQMPARH